MPVHVRRDRSPTVGVPSSLRTGRRRRAERTERRLAGWRRAAPCADRTRPTGEHSPIRAYGVRTTPASQRRRSPGTPVAPGTRLVKPVPRGQAAGRSIWGPGRRRAVVGGAGGRFDGRQFGDELPVWSIRGSAASWRSAAGGRPACHAHRTRRHTRRRSSRERALARWLLCQQFRSMSAHSSPRPS